MKDSNRHAEILGQHLWRGVSERVGNQFSEGLRKESDKIRCTYVYPGVVESELAETTPFTAFWVDPKEKLIAVLMMLSSASAGTLLPVLDPQSRVSGAHRLMAGRTVSAAISRTDPPHFRFAPETKTYR